MYHQKNTQKIERWRSFLLAEQSSIFNGAIRGSKKMTLAKVMCLTLRDSGTIQEKLFNVFNPRKEQRKNCGDLLKVSFDMKCWLLKSVYHL